MLCLIIVAVKNADVRISGVKLEKSRCNLDNENYKAKIKNLIIKR